MKRDKVSETRGRANVHKAVLKKDRVPSSSPDQSDSSPSHSVRSESITSPQRKRVKRESEDDLDMTVSEYEESCLSAPRRSTAAEQARVQFLAPPSLEKRPKVSARKVIEPDYPLEEEQLVGYVP